jgi:hypothetical protein
MGKGDPKPSFEADRDRAKKAADLGVHLRVLKGRPELAGLLAQVRDSGAVPMTELAQLAGLSRSYLYEHLGEADPERQRER